MNHLEIVRSFRSDEYARERSQPPFRDKAWLEWGLSKGGHLYIRGSFSGYHCKDWVKYTTCGFGITMAEMLKIVIKMEDTQ